MLASQVVALYLIDHKALRFSIFKAMQNRQRLPVAAGVCCLNRTAQYCTNVLMLLGLIKFTRD